MENDERLNKPIGNKESETLEAKDVVVAGVKIEPVYRKKDKSKPMSEDNKGEQVGEMVRLICKHPDREETLEISKAAYLKGDKKETSGLWYNEDEDGNVAKQSTLAQTMKFNNITKLSEFEGKTVQTTLDNGYIILKAYQ